ncbi:MAG: putative Ig domain-containing protein, partial [Nitrososphaerales archaeon]
VAKGAVTITISGPTSTNANVQTSYSASISGYSATNFEWDWDPGVGGNTYIKTTYQTYSECDITWNSPGTKTITVTYVNIANGTTYSQTKTVTVNAPAPPTITTTSPLNDGETGKYYEIWFTAIGGTGTGYTWSLYSGNLPPGLTLSPSGVLSGYPTTAGPYTFTVKVKDSANNTATSSFSLSVYAPLTITTSSLQNGKVGEYYSASLSATGGSGGYTWSLYYSDLPSNLTLSPSGTISGTPTTANSYSFTVQVKDSANNTATKSFSITITSNLTITTSSLPNGTVGQSYSATLQTTGAYGSVTWTITSGSLPSGVTLNNSTGVISGTPTVSGPFNITVQAKDSGNNSTTKSFSFTINSSITITTNTLSNGTTGQSYSQTLQATGGTGTGYTWSLYSGSLPPGLTLSPSGVLSGTPTTAGPYTFTVKVTDSANNYATKSFSITITSNLTITTSSLPNGTVGQSYSVSLSATGGYGSYTWSVISGGLPNGVNLNSSTGQISGTPTNAGPCNVTIQVKDSGNNIATKDFSFTIYSTLSITTTSVPTGIVNQSYSATLQATGGSGGYTWSLYSGNLPNGLTLSPSGTISGTPTAQGQFDFSVMVTDSLNNYATKAFTMIINGVLTITTNTLPDGFINQSYSQTLQATGGTGTGYTWSLYSGNLPPGLTLSPSGVLSGTPTTAGPYSFTVKVTDSANNTATKNFTMQILEGKIITSFTASPSSDSNNPLPSGTTVTLSWSTQGINNVKLYSSTDGTNWNIIGTYPGNSSTTVSPGTTIYYKITDESDASINKTVIVYVTNGISATESLNPSSGTVNSIISVTVSGAVTNNGDPYSNTLNIKIDATSLNWGS